MDGAFIGRGYDTAHRIDSAAGDKEHYQDQNNFNKSPRIIFHDMHHITNLCLRRGWDSNPRCLLRHSCFQDKRDRPLCHPSLYLPYPNGIMLYMQSIPWGLFVIRIGLAGVLLWFGTQQFIDPAYWSGYVPAWATALLPLPITGIVYMNAALEITGGMLILFGFFTRLAALVMGAHLALIALSLGPTEIAVRDWGLAFAFFGLTLAGGGSFMLERAFVRTKLQ